MPKHLKKAGFKEIMLWLLGRRKRFKVQGQSMLPLLKAGDEVLIKPGRSFLAGDIVVFRHPIQSDLKLIKQVDSFKEGRIKVKGLAEKSSDSRVWGDISRDHILGRVTALLKN